MTGFQKSYVDLRTTNGRDASLLSPIIFKRPDEVGGGIITMPTGSRTDGASTPAMVWSLGLAPFGSYYISCVLHDGCYRGITIPKIETREEADLILWEALVSQGVHDTEAKTIYNAVRQFGQSAWDQDRKEQA